MNMVCFNTQGSASGRQLARYQQAKMISGGLTQIKEPEIIFYACIHLFKIVEHQPVELNSCLYHPGRMACWQVV